MSCVVEDKCERVFENRDCFIEADAMFPNVACGFCGIPLESHIYILPQLRNHLIHHRWRGKMTGWWEVPSLSFGHLPLAPLGYASRSVPPLSVGHLPHPDCDD